MARRPEKDSVSDMEGRPNWSLLERSDLSEEFEAILNHRDKSALKNLVGQTDKWKALRKDLLVQAVDLLGRECKKAKRKTHVRCSLEGSIRTCMQRKGEVGWCELCEDLGTFCNQGRAPTVDTKVSGRTQNRA